jgi:phage shock protein PspC (stress-responsive transcriptional regulator)
MFCNACGRQIPDDAQICAYCGKAVAGSVAHKRLVRVREGRQIAGVCKGVAQYFGLDVSLVRIVWLVCAAFGLLGVVAYFAAWIIMPEEPLALSTGTQSIVNTRTTSNVVQRN